MVLYFEIVRGRAQRKRKIVKRKKEVNYATEGCEFEPGKSQRTDS